MKRSFYEAELENSITMANCLMLLSHGRETQFPSFEALKNSGVINSPSRVFECKTCNRQFPSFQALGGHRASHKKPRLTGGGGDGSSETQSSSSSSSSAVAKPKTHECSVCGLEFAIGQALGGHMRRHRGALNDQSMQLQQGDGNTTSRSAQVVMPPIVKKSNSRRVLCLDLNLTPCENDLELFSHGKAPPNPMVIDCFF
ncbi:zinc finger protein ZAT11 [Manihot esculenta]|uniref:C2H2-type domain-containing protein n=1 Tax=Manihot esculenta TaxID=3983 RepID=A0A2C9V302_MANES|nr:zinc finger protein ZAT11 [Manihot esculenta]OAY38694.1 hypothetical protein MANES_10G036200v8 [Manihot esculenta]